MPFKKLPHGNTAASAHEEPSGRSEIDGLRSPLTRAALVWAPHASDADSVSALAPEVMRSARALLSLVGSVSKQLVVGARGVVSVDWI